MPVSKKRKLKIRPYARLLTMLGDQLIKNERIAIIELIKNSYDADAKWVKISFMNFGKNYEIKYNSKIIIEDDGCGMTDKIIENHWLNPATPEKRLKKEKVPRTPSGRVIQGDKGIGRFAILKLGRKIKITTRAATKKQEHVVDYDFSKYDDEFLKENKKAKILFLDDLRVTLNSRTASVIVLGKLSLGTRKATRKPHGTRIEISDLKGSWTEKKVELIAHDISRLESIFSGQTGMSRHPDSKSPFNSLIYKDGKPQKYHEQFVEKLNILLEDRSVIQVKNGTYDENKKEFRFTLNEKPAVIKLSDPQLMGLKVFKDYFGVGGKVLDNRKTECGSFRFGFYVFDFDPSDKVPAKYKLDVDDKRTLREHRIYLYRDGIRVYPYGEPDDDWLRIDAYRGTIAAGHFLSNDQVVGYVNITQKENTKLKDKTNREGLIEEGDATSDFIALLQIFLAYVRQKPYARYKNKLKNKKVQDIFHTEQVQKKFDELKESFKDNKKAVNLISKAEKGYKAERKYLVQRAETTEDLAGVGLSVETASHDIMAIMHKAMIMLDSLMSDILHDDELDFDELQKELQSLRGMLSFIEAQLKDIQLLFKSSKKRRRNIKVKEILSKVERIYKRLLKKEKIELVVHQTRSPLIAKTTDAVLLQLFLNLFDNAIYWLQQTAKKTKTIEIYLDGNKGKLIFSDNGPGVEKEDKPYIFEPFFSGKGEEGRGLGLYIARQLLERNDYSIELAELKKDRLLGGANFVVDFVPTEED